MPRLRLMLLGLGLFALAWAARWVPSSAHAQPVQPAPGMNSNGVGAAMGLNLADRILVRRVVEAEKLLAKGDDISAVGHLQFILNLQQDGFFRPADEQAGRFISLKQQTEDLLKKASPATLQIYERQYGAEARTLLNEAVARRDPKLAQAVMRRFLHTAAGAEAANWLGSYHIDRADYASALQCLSRLRRLPDSDHWEPQLALKMALCLSRTGRIEKAQAVIREAVAKAKNPIQIGGQTLTPQAGDTQILAWLQTVAPPQLQIAAEPTGWLMPRGNAEHNLLLHSSPPVGKSLWNVPLSEWKVPGDENPEQEATLDVRPQMQALTQVHVDKSLFPLPSSSPLLVNEIVVARFYDHLAGFDLKTGRELWRSAENDRAFHLLLKNLSRKDDYASPITNRNRTPRDFFALMLRQRTWEDLTFGNLSSDGDYVFSLEDLGLLNDLSVQTGAPQSHPLVMRDYNRMCAHEVRTGKLKWELGGPRGDVTLDLPGTFFLGPPLPVDHQLFCIVESQAQTQLLALDARTGKALWTQSLSQPVDDLIREPQRRRAGLTPALMGDMLVCPTGSGLVVAVDVAAQSLAWAYQYVAAPSNDPRDPRMRRRQMAMMGIPQVEMDPLRGAEVNEWQDGSPILAEGFVILTPRDSPELHCLSLEDGKIAWRLPRKEGLYVAAVQNGLVVVVGSRSVEALRLTDGKPAWPQPVPLMNQAGRGIVTETQILLPLVSNEVATIDLKSGRPLTRAKIYDAAGVGNLIPGPGIILTQSADSLAAYRTLDSVSVETAQRLAMNPMDPEALAQRGEYRLSQGDLAQGQADLRLSLKQRKSADTQTVLFDSLLQGLQTDFAGHRQLLVEIEQLAQTPAQFSALYRIWGVGLLAAGDTAAAFDILLKLCDAGLGKAELERLDGHRSLRRDQWVRAQLLELLPKVDAATQQHVQDEMRKRLTVALADKGVEPLRNFLRFFGSHPLADEARQTLVERIVATGYTLEAEQLVSQLRRSTNPQTAGGALAVMIRELIKLQRPEECEDLLAELAAKYGDVVCLPNQTGLQLAESWKKVVVPRPKFAQDWPTGRVDVTRSQLPLRNPSWVYDVFLDGDRGPFFKHSQFKATQDSMRVVGLNGWGEPSWALPLSELGPSSNVNAFRAQVRNHFVLLTTGAQVVAINALTEGNRVGASKLWGSPLIEGQVGDQNQVFQMIINRPGVGRQRLGLNNWQTPAGMVGAITDDSVAVLRGRHLILTELLSGQQLWKRTDMVAGSEVFGDAESVFVMRPDSLEAEQIRRLDGLTLGQYPVPHQNTRLLTIDRTILSYAKDATKNLMTFTLTDVPGRKPIWERSFDMLSQYSVFSDTELVVMEPSGMLTLIAVPDGRVVWQRKVELAPNYKEMWVIPDGDRLLLVHGEMPPRANPQAAMFIGNNQTLIDGQADSISRTTGQHYWSQRVERFALDTGLPQFLPVWVFSSLTASIQAGNIVKPEFQLLVVDKRSGRVVLKSSEANHVNTYQVKMEPAEKRVDITLVGGPQAVQHQLKWTDQPEDGPAAK